MVMRRADSGHNPFANARNNRFLGRPANQTVEVCAHGNPRFDFKLNAITGDRIDRRTCHRA